MQNTQYIGLTGRAQNWVSKALSIEQYQMTTGMFAEPIIGTIYTLRPRRNSKSLIIAKEVEQFQAWSSSGPMIFTHLKITLVNGGQEVDGGYYYSWVCDPTVVDQLDFSIGAYYI